MSEPSNSEILAAVNALDKRLQGIEKGQSALATTLGVVLAEQREIAQTVNAMQESEHTRGLGLAERVERIEQHLGIAQ